MLAELKIENVAVIEKAEVQFTPGLNVLTGETGAGKSIMIDSINAILGNRTSRDLVRSGAPKARIWATFESIPAHVREQVEKCGYGAQDDLLLYREISADGKGSCRINGMPATAGVVRDISAGLLTIHGQHDSTSLTNPATHLALLDQYAQDGAEYAAYHALYRALVTAKRALDAGHMVLVKCFSGMANAACEVFDAQTWEGVVGTLSGDDTFFILMRTEENAAEITRQLQRYTVRHT